MKYPKNDLAQLVIASCVANGIEDVVISPGSRNAPLTIGFKHHPKIKTYSIVDERCAAFVALGMAQQKQKPVAVVCTSGSALLNYYPAFSEAFYSDIPLVVLSADRPDHMIDIGDGQTIRQKNVFENHSLYNANLVVDANEKNKTLLNEALETSIQQKGPVHINIPFDEPLYETVETIIEFPLKKHVDPALFYETEIPLDVDFLQTFADKWNNASKKIVLIGTCFPDALLEKQILHLLKDPSVLIFAETISNQTHPKIINQIDQLIFPLEDVDFEKLQPEILLTIGGMVVSKRIKQFLRKYQPKQHWHVDFKTKMDTYYCLNHHFKISPQLFFSQFFFLTKEKSSDYQQYWLQQKEKRQAKHQIYLDKIPFSDFKVFDAVLKSIPSDAHLQLGNSSVIRYAQLFNLKPTLKVFCNRGTSGIDGSTSTAIGAAMTTEKQTVFITGDISFFYDSNALWNAYVPKNFRIILLNNGGGTIFKFIPGPTNSNALDYFETPHNYTAEHLCKMYGFEYDCVENNEDLKLSLHNFYKEGTSPKLLEVQTLTANNDVILKEYFNSLSEK
jgi:2-succinyl-5-enolpyruvyl-6-hydroxy-3-cyclohexene-1-carboxylate synthase